MPSASYGWAQPTVRTLCELDPSNIRFCLEPDRATLHYVALCIRGLMRSSAKLGGPEWLAPRLARDNRRSLLREIWGADLGSPKLLSRCRGGVWKAGHYDQLAAVLSDKDRCAAFARLSSVRSKNIDALAEAPLQLVRHAAMETVLRHGVPATAYIVAGILRCDPSMTEQDAFLRLKRLKSSSDFVIAIHDVLLDSVLPEPPWLGTPTVRPLRTLREVREAANRFENCLRDPTRALRVLAGELAIYVADSPKGPVCASLKHDRALQSWRLNEMKGVRNARVSPAVYKSIKTTFETAGFPYLPEGRLGYWFDR